MTLRITNEDQIQGLPANIKAQIERGLNNCECDSPTGGHAEPERKIQTHSKRKHPEQDAGKMLIQWIDLLHRPDGLRPGLYFCHTPNGGFRNPIEAAIFYGQGVRKGWPDYTLYIPRGRYHGLVGELKAENGSKPEPEQLAILRRLEIMGYKACVWWGFDDAKQQIEQYLDLTD